MENPYGRAPLQVTLYDVPTGVPVRSYMFMGDAPRAVIVAARRGTPVSKHAGRLTFASEHASAWPETTWGADDAATLQRHYGARWRWLLTPRVGTITGPPCVRAEGSAAGGAAGGGAEEGGGGFGDLDDFDEDPAGEREGGPAPPGGAAEEEGEEEGEERGPAPDGEGEEEEGVYAIADWDPRTVFVRAAAYPEDTFADLKGKIYVATGIPPYRQHLFYPVGGDEGADERDGWDRPTRTTYRVTVEGGLVLTDVRRLSLDYCAALRAERAEAVAGVPVDRRLEERKDEVRVDAFDAFRSLEDSPGAYVRRVFVADLASLIRVRGAEMQKALADRYFFDLLYYGLILKYWPALSPEAFRLVLADPAAVGSAFPLLAPPLAKLTARFAAERALVDRVYARARALEEAHAREGGVAVTEATFSVETRAAKTPVNLRNVFDWLPTSRTAPVFTARVPPDAVEDHRGAGAARGRRDFFLEKAHVSAAGPLYAAGLKRFLARPLRRPCFSCALLRAAPRGAEELAPAALPQFIYLTVYAGGRYTVESSWREGDRIGFDEAVRQLSGAARPVIETINSMGAAALPLGGVLETPAEASKGGGGRTAFGALTVSVYWPSAFSTDGFQRMKALWREYEKAGLIGVRGLQQGGGYAFFFRKGVTRYDPSAFDRAAAAQRGGAGPSTVNGYAHLTDPALAQRWAHLYGGRPVYVHHRATDLRIEMVGVDLDEFERIRRYALVLLDAAAGGEGRRRGDAHPPAGATRLRSLQEQDPDLFDLKKYDLGASFYSVICQGDRQPEAVSEEEARGLSAVENKSLVRFWNFTRGVPAFYRCPSKTFPYLSFRAGEHPLGYCLPCCKKTRPLAGSKAEAVNRACLERHRLADDGEECSAAARRHVLSYGKDLPAGRLAHPPPLLTDGLFYDTLPEPYVYRLLGVPQHAPGLPHAGFFYALAAVLNLEPPDFIRDLAETALALRESFRSLANGGASVFASAGALADALLGSFVAPPGGGFSPFGPGGAAAGAWRGILADLVHIRYDLDVVEFVDAGDGGLVLEAGPASADRLRRALQGVTAVDVAVLVSTPAGSYPFFALDQKAFLAHADGRGPARRFFSSSYPDDREVQDRLVEIVCAMAVGPPRGGGWADAFGLDFVSELCAAEGFQLLYRLINLRDMCYGVVLAPDPAREAELVYFPVPYAPHFLPPVDPARRAPVALYGPRPPGRYPPQALARVLQRAAAFRRGPGPLGQGARLAPVARLVAGPAVVGFIAALAQGSSPPGGARLFFYHDPAAAADVPWGAAPEAAVPYDPLDVDRAIYAAGGAPAPAPLPPDKEALAVAGVYRLRLYRLFLAEFAALLQKERNLPVRAEILALFARTKFGSPASLAAFRADLAVLLRSHPGDAEVIRGLIAMLHNRVGPQALRSALVEAFDASSFDFDRTTLNRLRALGDQDRVEAELAVLLRPRVELVDESEPCRVENVYVACSLSSEVARPQCLHGRLRMPPDRFSAYVSILAADVLNPFKAATLGALTAGVVDGGRFLVRPGELIVIR